MLPKSRRALTIQEIAALARSSLHGNCSPRGASGKGGSPEVRSLGLLARAWRSLVWSWGGAQGVTGGTQEEGIGVPGPVDWRQGVLGPRVMGPVVGTWGAVGHADVGAHPTGISQVVKEHVTKPTAMAQGRVAHLIEWKGWCKPVESPSALESAFSSYCHLSEGEQEARFAAGRHRRHSRWAWSPLLPRAGAVGWVVPIHPSIHSSIHQSIHIMPLWAERCQGSGILGAPPCMCLTHACPVPGVAEQFAIAEAKLRAWSSVDGDDSNDESYDEDFMPSTESSQPTGRCCGEWVSCATAGVVVPPLRGKGTGCPLPGILPSLASPIQGSGPAWHHGKQCPSQGWGSVPELAVF